MSFFVYRNQFPIEIVKDLGNFMRKMNNFKCKSEESIVTPMSSSEELLVTPPSNLEGLILTPSNNTQKSLY
jgi:hypothetical protein